MGDPIREESKLESNVSAVTVLIIEGEGVALRKP